MTLARRALLLGTAGGIAASASACRDATVPATYSATTPTVAPTRTPASPPAADPSSLASAPPKHPRRPHLPRPTPWRPTAGEIEPAIKLAAVRHLERAHTSPHERLRVLYAQYGGLLPDSASVLVPSLSQTLRQGAVVPGGHTFDVRLSRRGSRWVVTEVFPSRPGPRARRLSLAARRVLAHDRIDLPPASADDIASGQVEDSVLEALLRLAAAYRVGVSVMRSGHPLHVFGTDRLSDHPRGLAVDVWRIDGHPVVAPSTPRRLVEGFMRRAVALGADNVGGPTPLAGAAYFSDRTHHDHVHLGFPG